MKHSVLFYSIYLISISQVDRWNSLLVGAPKYLLDCNPSSTPLLGCCATGENTITLHRSSVMFYTGSQFLFESSLRSAYWSTSRFIGPCLAICATIVRRRIRPLRVYDFGTQKCFLKDSRKISFYPQYFLMTFFENRKLQKINTQQKRHGRRADKLSAAARRSTKVGGGAHKLSAVARPVWYENLCGVVNCPENI